MTWQKWHGRNDMVEMTWQKWHSRNDMVEMTWQKWHGRNDMKPTKNTKKSSIIQKRKKSCTSCMEKTATKNCFEY